MYLERVIYPARHIEVQTYCRSRGSCCPSRWTDCSLQRNNQKVLEESPSIAIGKTLRNEIAAAAIRAAESVGWKCRYDWIFSMKRVAISTSWKWILCASWTPSHRVCFRCWYCEGTDSHCRPGNPYLPNKKILSYEVMLSSAGSMQKIQHLTLLQAQVKLPHLPSGGVGLRVDSAVYPGYTILLTMIVWLLKALFMGRIVWCLNEDATGTLWTWYWRSANQCRLPVDLISTDELSLVTTILLLDGNFLPQYQEKRIDFQTVWELKGELWPI